LLLVLLLGSIVEGLSPFRRVAFPVPRLRQNPDKASYDVRYFTQRLDHFDFSNDIVFQQKYLISEKYWGNRADATLFNSTTNCPGPIFFYTGNEGAIEMFWDNTGFVTEYLGPKYGALVVFAEHRYYGETLPFGKNSFKGNNPRWLSSEQALADYAVLIPFLKSKHKGETCPVISFGGSYGGMLTGWFRLKYPNVVNGGIAASAPVLQFYNTGVTQWIFNQIITADFKEAGCSDFIHQAFVLIQKTGSTQQGLTTLTNKFNLCFPLTNVNDLINWAENALTSLAMIDYPYPTNFLEPVPGWPVKVSCQQMTQSMNKNHDLLSSFAVALGVY